MNNWYDIQDIEDIDSPSVVLYEDRLMHNLHTMIDMVDRDLSRLMPHIKTNKIPEVVDRMISLGISVFKSSTIAEAEMAAQQGARSVLIAHQLVGPRIKRFGTLIKAFPDTQFSTIVDNIGTAVQLKELGQSLNASIGVYIDINSGMNRSGVEIGDTLNELLQYIAEQPHLNLLGLHVYDGHFRQSDLQERMVNVENEMLPVSQLFAQLKRRNPNLTLICGGTPSFSTHLVASDRICSPGTCVFWDWGYSEKLVEQDFKYATLLITRVISKPTMGIVTIDLGHKSVGPENPIDKRIKFLNLEDYELVSQSEEHGVLKVNNWKDIEIGDVFYGVPYHICPTINLHSEVSVIERGHKVATWQVIARRRKINI